MSERERMSLVRHAVLKASLRCTASVGRHGHGVNIENLKTLPVARLAQIGRYVNEPQTPNPTPKIERGPSMLEWGCAKWAQRPKADDEIRVVPA